MRSGTPFETNFQTTVPCKPGTLSPSTQQNLTTCVLPLRMLLGRVEVSNCTGGIDHTSTSTHQLTSSLPGHFFIKKCEVSTTNLTSSTLHPPACTIASKAAQPLPNHPSSRKGKTIRDVVSHTKTTGTTLQLIRCCSVKNRHHSAVDKVQRRKQAPLCS